MLVAPPEAGQSLAVAAQVVRERGQAHEPPLVAGVAVAPALADDLALGRGVRGERGLDEPGHRDDVPLEALGRVDRHDLHRVGTGLDPAEVEPALLVDGGLEPGEEAAQRRAVGARREGRGDVGEGVEVGPGGARRPPGPGEHLDVEPQGRLGLADELGQPEAGQGPQSPDGGAEAVQALQRGRADALALLPHPGGRREVVERLDDARLLAGVAREVGPALAPAGALPGPRPRAQPVEVGRAEAAGGSGEQAHEPVAARGVLDRVEQGDEVGHLGHVEQPAEADDLVGHAGGLEGVDDRVELGSLAAQDRCGATRRAGRGRARDPLRDVRASSSMVVSRATATWPGPAPAGRERPHLHPARRGERAGDDVRGVEHGPVVAPARREVEHAGRLGVVAEVGAEAVEGRRRAPRQP